MHDTIVNIPVSGAFYEILSKHLFKLIERQEDPKKAISNIAEKNELTVDESLMKVLGMIIKTVEDTAEEKNLFKYIETPEEDIPTPSSL